MPREFDQEAKDRAVGGGSDLCRGIVDSRRVSDGRTRNWESGGTPPSNGYSNHAKPAMSRELRKTWFLKTLGYAGRFGSFAIRTSY